jgi:hypothetical protein
LDRRRQRPVFDLNDSLVGTEENTMIGSADAVRSGYRRARRRLGKMRKTRMMVRALGSRVVAQGQRLDTQKTRIAAQSREQARISKQLQEQTKQVERLAKAVSEMQELKARLVPFDKASKLRELEHGRFSYQIGGIEQRLGALEQRLSDGTFVADDAATAEARSIIDEVRREHEQIRIRMQIVSAYEERLRRVETSVAELYDGDLRHQV